MKNLIIFGVLFFTIESGFCQYPPLVGAKKFQSVDKTNSLNSILVTAVDNQGNYYSNGYFRDSIRPDQNLNNYYLTGNENYDSGIFAKYDANGNVIWANKIVPKVGYLYVNHLALDKNNNVFILCNAIYTDSIDFDPGVGKSNTLSDGNDFYFAKYDANGNFLWVKLLNVANSTNAFSNTPTVIKIDSLQNIYIGGRFQSQLEIDPSSAIVNLVNPNGVNCNCTVGFYAKFNSQGGLLWSKIDGNNTIVNSIDVYNPTGEILIGSSPSRFSGDPLRICNSSGTSLNVLNGSGIGVSSARFDNEGSIYFSGVFFGGGNDFDWGSTSFMMSTPNSSETVGFVGKYDNTKKFKWASRYEAVSDPAFKASTYGLAFSSDANPIVYFGESNGNYNLKGFFKIDGSNGTELWTKSVFNVLVGLSSVSLVPNPKDGSIIFSAGAGFSSNSVTTIDMASDPLVTNTITGKGYWSLVAKYGDCNASPPQPTTISGLKTLCDLNVQTYTVSPAIGVVSYAWTLPSGWVGTSTTNSIIVSPSTNSGIISVSANNLCDSSPISTVNVVFTGKPNIVTNASTSICSGTSIILTATGAVNYSWSNEVINGQAFVPLATATYTVTGSSNGCNNIALTTITVQPKPNVGALTSSTTICFGEFATLNGSGANTYQWSNGVLNGVSFKPSLTDTYTVLGTDLNNCTSTSTIVINVNSRPNVVASASSSNICSGASITLTATGAVNYSWSNGVANGQPFVPLATSTYTVSGTSNGCSNIALTTITVHPKPNVGALASSTTICFGEFATLNGSGANTYQWSNGVLNGVSFKPSLTNTYTVIGIDLDNCTSSSTVLVTVNPKPNVTVNDTTICTGETATLRANGANTYIWSSGATPILYNTASVNPTSTSIFTVVGLNTLGCKDTAYSNVNIYCVLAQDDIYEKEFYSVFPSPSTGTFYINTPSENINISIVNIYGQELVSFSSTNKPANLYIKESGIYLVQFHTGREIVKRRLIISP